MPSPDATPASSPALRVAIVGAESTGKSVLARALAQALHERLGLHTACVGEYLREWCDERARTPRPDEQRAIAEEQQRRIDAAADAPGVDVVLCDTSPLMTAVYSALLFDDASLDDFAARCQRRADLTLLTALDLPWVADGLQRDGPHVREPVDRRVRGHLLAWGVPWAVVSGHGDARTAHALDALRPLIAARPPTGTAPRAGLFSSLLAAPDDARAPASLSCDCCER